MTDGVASEKVPDVVGTSKVEQLVPEVPKSMQAKQASKEPLPSSSQASTPPASSGPQASLESPPNSPPQPVSKKPSRATKIPAPDVSHGDSTTRKSAATGIDSPSVILMRRWLQRHRILICRCTLSTSLAAVAAAVLFFAYFRQDLFYPSELLKRPPQFLCSKAAEAVRSTLNFSVNPCDDFYSFVCSPGGDGSVRGEGSAIAWKQIDRNLMNVPWESDRQGVENKAARFFRSCRRLVSAVTINVKDHAEVLFSLIPEVSVNAILQFKSSEELLELMSVVSLKYGLSAFLSFASGPNEKLYVVGVRPPLSTYLNDIDLRLVLANTVEILQLGYAVSERTVQRLMKIENDLQLHHGKPTQHKKEALSNTFLPNATYDQANPEQTTEHQRTLATRRTSFVQSPRNAGAYSAYEEDGSSSFLETKRNSSGSSADDIINTFLPPQKYVVQVGDLGTLRNTLHAIFVDMNTSESAVYVLAFLLLPENLLMVYANRRDMSVCYKLLRFAFWDVWEFLATRMNLAVSHTGDALFITEAVLTTLKKIAMHRNGNRQFSASVIEDKIEKLLTLVSSDTGVVYPRWMDGLESMSVRSLYRNIIELGKFRKTQAPDGNVSITSNGSVKQEQSMKFRVPVEDLAPPSYCNGPFRFLNYATLGTSVALEALKSLGLTFSEARGLAKTPALISQGVQRAMSCFGAEITLLHWPELEGGSKHEKKKLLVDVIFWATSFQIALEASELEQARTPREILEPVMLQTFYARYCSHLCERAEDPFFRRDDARWANLKCNIAVMNVPKFAPLFQCKRDQVLFKTEYCSVF